MVLATILLAAVSTSATEQALEVYHVKHRPAKELLSIAEVALSNEGQVALDSRTATLILSGTPAAVGRALILLEELDRSLRQVVLTHQVLEQRDLEALGVRVAWKISLGSVRMGTLPLHGEGLQVAIGARREGSRSLSQSVLRLLEGGSGLIVTGEALPFIYEPYWGRATTEFIPVETGFEATVSVLGDGRVGLDLRPFSGRVDESGALRYTMAATSLTLSPGETLVVGEVSREVNDTGMSLEGGKRDQMREQQVLLVSVEIEQP
jgi:hypothetical protein